MENRPVNSDMSKALFVALAFIAVVPHARAQTTTPAEARAIAKDAYIYGYPLVDNYRIQYSYFVDRNNPNFKAPWNTINNVARVFTPADTSIQTPNSDTPYSQLGADLRAEPLVLSVPEVEPGRLLLASIRRHVHVQYRLRRHPYYRQRSGKIPAGGASLERREARRHQGCHPVRHRLRFRAIPNATLQSR
jgi:hypothetical protein